MAIERPSLRPADRFVFGFVAAGINHAAGLLARMHHGRLNAYVAYVLLTLVVFLIIAAWR